MQKQCKFVTYCCILINMIFEHYHPLIKFTGLSEKTIAYFFGVSYYNWTSQLSVTKRCLQIHAVPLEKHWFKTLDIHSDDARKCILAELLPFKKGLGLYTIIFRSLVTFVCISVLVFHGRTKGQKVLLFFSFVISAVRLLHRLISAERTGVNASSIFLCNKTNQMH